MDGVSRLLDLDFADLDAAAAARHVAGRAADAPFAYVVTPNADHLGRLAKDASLLPVYRGAWLRLMDSRVIAGAARLLRLPTPAVAPGSDVTRLLLTEHLQPGERVTIVGLEPQFLPALVARCGLAAPAHCYPPMGFDRRPKTFQAVVDFVLANPARFIFLAVGSPRQERLCAAIAATGRATGTALCVGASLEFLAGRKTRAPSWMQRMGLEWLHRLSREPRLLRRYLIDCPPVLLSLLAERKKHRLGLP